MTDTPSYRSARDLVAAMSRGEQSSRALLEASLARIAQHNPAINAVVALDLDTARRAADAADAAARRGETLGALHGLPMTIKDTFEVPGMACTAGAPAYRNHRPPRAAVAVQRLQDAGAIVFGKTNVPYLASDLQSYNRVYGVTHNPWNRALTAGGSSGGAAAALAAGFTPVELGSDIAGSIRIPAHFCGVYGHKPTHGIISLRGHVPGPPGTLSEPQLAVAGPMARTADDLDLMMDVLVGPGPAMAAGWQVSLPPARRDTLREFRVLLWLDDPHCPLDDRMLPAYRRLQDTLVQAGVTVDVGAPLDWPLDKLYPVYVEQLSSGMLVGAPGYVRNAMRAFAPAAKLARRVIDVPRHADRFLAGAGMSHADWIISMEKTQRLKEKFLTVFETYDVILAPPALTTAFAHDHSGNLGQRKVDVAGQKRHYLDLFMWIAPATLLGLPATSAPVGRTAEGAPVNIQIIGAPYEDRSTIRFAHLLAEVAGGFQPPPALA
ncbi:MAG: amidase [Moraxellaceae bacterium]|jgi:amidase|nr:amidase [Moraxellaceae bacterium]